MKTRTCAAILLTIAPALALAAPFLPGNLLVATENVVYETSPAGQIVQQFPTEYPGGYPVTEYARDVAVGEDGVLHVFNGTFSPYMSTYDPLTGAWDHRTHPGFSIANNGSYGGIDALGSRVFVTDGLTNPGVIMFDVASGQVQGFAQGVDAIDLTLGLDGLLYVLSPSGSPGGRIVDVFDPDTYAFVRSLNLADIFGWTEHRSIAVDHNGDIFIADWDGEIHRVSAAGQLIATITPECQWSGSPSYCSFNDIAISADGQLALGSRFGEIIVTDVDFASVTRFQVGDRGAFVEFVPAAGPREIDIDISPGKFPNEVRLHPWRYVKVALLSDESFDATTADPASIRFGPAGAPVYGGYYRLVDVDGDLDWDLVVRFRVGETGIQCGDESATLTGNDFAGEPFVGTDSIVVVGRYCN